MLTNDVSSDIEKIIKTQPVESSPPGDDYVGRGDLPGKLSAFEKLIRHAISRFSMDRVYDLLRIVTTELRTQTAAQEAAAAAAALAAAAAANEEEEETTDGHDDDTERDKEGESSPENDDEKESSSVKDVDNKSVKSDKSNRSSDRASVKSAKSSDSSNETTEKIPSKNEKVTKTVSITSLKQVRDIIKGLELIEAGDGKLTDRQIVALRHYATFAKDLAYLCESKTYFYDNIYWSLLQDFYDPNEPIESRTSQSPPDNEKHNTSPDSSGTRKNRKMKNSNRLPKNNGKKPEAPKESDRKRIHNVVSEVEETMSKWSGLLEEEDQKLEYFDQDSHHEVVHYLHCAPFELVFRVVPDVFIKCYRALDLSREWIKIAERIYKGRLPLRRKVTQDEEPVETVQEEEQKNDVQETEEAERKSMEATVETYNNHMQKIKARIGNVTEVLQSHESQMTELTKEMQTLKTREDRVDKLNANFERADSKLQTAQKEFSKYLNERQKTIDEIADIPPGSLQHSELSKRAESLDKELTKRQIELGLLEYQKSVVQEDFLLELELRPNFIHFVGDVQGKITDIKTDAHKKKNEKKKLEKQLSLMITNTDKVKAVMAEYLGREPNDSDMEIAVRLASVGEADDNDEEPQENGQVSDDGTDYWQKETKNYDSDGSVGLDSDQSFVSVSDDVDLTEFLPSNVVFGEMSSADRKMAGKTGGSKISAKRKAYIPQSSQQFSDAMRVLSPNSNPTSQRGYTGPKKLKPHSKVYKQMHATSYRPS
ncbi:uncharacterized protein LOC117344196 [Pecten maximus]|uniref:uncharacterized protein LOC117344196 n=1 Tax=Pecten maximus TaxID=6579 RepID=UPI001458E979|nr:uncharacterized protein LOC117344196 [Pecten maximus]XP_033762748.1 uncharacterized protein LOC117344196 [Pecten maximus]